MKVTYELIGVWGSGKSTISGCIKNIAPSQVEIKEYTDFNSIPTAHIMRTNVACTVVTFLRVLILYLKLLTVKGNSFQDVLTYFKTHVRSSLLRKYAENFTLSWEGDYHLLTLLHWPSILSDTDLLTPYKSNSAYHRVIPVFVETTFDDAIKRINRDKDSSKNIRFSDDRFPDLDENKIKSQLGEIYSNQERLKEVFKENKIHYVVIQNLDSNCIENSVKSALKNLNDI